MRQPSAEEVADCRVSSSAVFSLTAEGGRKNKQRRVSHKRHPKGVFLFWNRWRRTRSGSLRQPPAEGAADCRVSSSAVFSLTAEGGRKNKQRRVSQKRHSNVAVFCSVCANFKYNGIFITVGAMDMYLCRIAKGVFQIYYVQALIVIGYVNFLNYFAI